LARLKPGVSVKQATAEAQSLLDQIHREDLAVHGASLKLRDPWHNSTAILVRCARPSRIAGLSS
jgi:hypothetical protein